MEAYENVLFSQMICEIIHIGLFLRSFMFSDDEEETKRVVRSQKDKRYVLCNVITVIRYFIQKDKKSRANQQVTLQL